MDRLRLMHSFARSVETGSFSAVARELHTGQPNISHQIATLERHLGVRLFHRSTRKLILTPEGERYYVEARQILEATSEAESNARGEDKPRGLLRVACPTVLGRSHVLPQVASFMSRFPGIQLDLQIDDRFIDLVAEGVDVAIRIGELGDSALRARKIGLAERVCVASVDYLARHPAPGRPAELSRHECILYSGSTTGNRWRFDAGEVVVTGRFAANNPDGIHQAVLDGIGIANAPVWQFEQALRDGSVHALLLDHPIKSAPMHLVYSSQRMMPLRARVFMDFITDLFGRASSLNEGSLARLTMKT